MTPAEYEAEIERLNKQSESWRLAHLAWQEWAAKHIPQPTGGEWGDEMARFLITKQLRWEP